MNVLFIVNSTKMNGGATKSFIVLLNGLVAKGIVPFVLLPDEDGLTLYLRQKGIRTIVAKYNMDIYPKTESFKQLFYFLPVLCVRRYRHYKTLQTLKKELIDTPIHLVHTNSSVISIGYEYARMRHIPHIFHIREYADLDFNMHYYPSSYIFHKKLHVNGSYSICITKGVLQHHGLNNVSNARVIYNGIMPKHKEPSLVSTDSFFLYAGRIEKAKGVMDLVRAYILYYKHTDNPLPLKLAGEEIDANYSLSLRDIIKRNNIPDGVIVFLGIVNHIEELMRTAKAIIIPSHFEAFGRCMPEAMANGCLTIGKNVAGTKEQYDNGLELSGSEIGLRYNTNEELVENLLRVTQSKQGYFDIMKQKAFNTVNSLYSEECYVDNVFQFYTEIMGNET